MMDTCTAICRNGNPCKQLGKYSDGKCGKHTIDVVIKHHVPRYKPEYEEKKNILLESAHKCIDVMFEQFKYRSLICMLRAQIRKNRIKLFEIFGSVEKPEPFEIIVDTNIGTVKYNFGLSNISIANVYCNEAFEIMFDEKKLIQIKDLIKNNDSKRRKIDININAIKYETTADVTKLYDSIFNDIKNTIIFTNEKINNIISRCTIDIFVLERLLKFDNYCENYSKLKYITDSLEKIGIYYSTYRKVVFSSVPRVVSKMSLYNKIVEDLEDIDKNNKTTNVITFKNLVYEIGVKHRMNNYESFSMKGFIDNIDMLSDDIDDD